MGFVVAGVSNFTGSSPRRLAWAGFLARVLAVGDLFHQNRADVIQRFDNGVVGHCRIRLRTVPVPGVRGRPIKVAGNFMSPQRSTKACMCAGTLSPWTETREAAILISRRSSCESAVAAAPIFSSSLKLRGAGDGDDPGLLRENHASASCAGVALFCAAKSASTSTSA